MRFRWLVWPLFAAIMGFALGGSVFWGLYGPNSAIQQVSQATEHQPTDHEAKSKKEETDEALAYYTLWLMVFTGVLAAATLGLGGATFGLYLTGEKQIGLIQQQAADTRILQRAYISVEPGGISASDTSGKCHPNIIIRNAGNLPARHVKWTIDWAADQNHRRSYLPIDESSAEGDNTMPPGSEMIQGGRIIYVGGGPNDIRKELGLYVYVWGQVAYEDGFGESRVTRYCHRYNCANLEDIMTEASKFGARIIYGRRIDKLLARFNRFGNEAT